MGKKCVWKRVVALTLALVTVLSTNGISVMASAVNLTEALGLTGEADFVYETNSSDEETKTDSNATLITTPEEFLAIYENLSGNYILGADINLSGYEIPNDSYVTFSGSLDGQGYTISGLEILSGYVYALFGGLSGTIQNLTISGAYVQYTSGDAYHSIGVLAGDFTDGVVYNCDITGTVKVSYNSEAVYIGGFFGYIGGGTVDSCGSYVNITAYGPYTIIAGGFANEGSVSNSEYSGTISVAQTGDLSDEYFKASGISGVASGCTVSGYIYVMTENAAGQAYGLLGADYSVNRASVVATTDSGASILAGGAVSGNCSSNSGRISATGTTSDCVSVTALGVSDMDTKGINTGRVTATVTAGYGTATAAGVSSCETGVNSGSVEAISDSGAASACGAIFSGDGGSNSGGVSAKTDNGSASAVGLGGSGESLDCSNSGGVSATAGSGKAVAIGLQNCSYSTNYGDVHVTYHGLDGEEGTAVATGVYGGSVLTNNGNVTVRVEDSATVANARGTYVALYSANYGDILAVSAAGNAIARGTESGWNTGNVTAESYGPTDTDNGNATAYGAYGGKSYNEGTVAATSAYGAARAYGVYSTEDSYSIGTVVATATYFTEDEDSGSIALAFASGSTNTRAVGYGYDISAANGESMYAYYFVASNGCLHHYMLENGFVTTNDTSQLYYFDSCYILCGYAKTETFEDYEEPEIPRKPSNNSSDSGDTDETSNVEIGGINLFEEAYDTSSVLSQLWYACGSFSFGLGGDIDVTDPDTSYYDYVYGRIILTASDLSSVTSEVTVVITLPDGLSFSPDDIDDTQRTYSVSLTSSVYNFWIPDPIYLIYEEGYETEDELTYEWLLRWTNADGTAETATDESSLIPLISVYSFLNPYDTGSLTNKAIIYRLMDGTYLASASYTWNASDFDSDSTTFNNSLSLLAAYMSEMMEKDDKELLKEMIAINLVSLGFSNIQYGGSSNGTEEEYVLATKKIVNEAGEVETVVLFAIQGSDSFNVSIEDWIGNFWYSQNGVIHENIRECGENNLSYYTDYMKKVGLTGVSDTGNRILITGHSRGGGIANYIAAAFDSGQAEACSNLYCYTFAGLNIANYGDYNSAIYNNIFNLINYKDVVPFVPGDLYKYGHNLVFNSDDTSNEALVSIIKKLGSADLTPAAIIFGALYCVSKLSAIDEAHSMTQYVNNLLEGKNDYVDYDTAAYKLDQNDTVKQMEEDAVILLAEMEAKLKIPGAYLFSLKDLFVSLPQVSYSAQSGKYRNTLTYMTVRGIINSKYNSIKAKICCPVDIEVLDADGNVLCQIVDNELVSYDEDSGIIVLIYGDEKELVLPDTGDYQLNITGYGDGTMDYSLIYMDEDGNDTVAYNFYDVPVQDGETTEAVIFSEENLEDDAVFLTDADSQVISPNETLSGDELNTIEVELESLYGGVVLMGVGSYTKGDYVSAAAFYEDDLSFEGWYDEEGNLVSDQAWYSFTAEEDIKLIAHFAEVTDDEDEDDDESGDGEGSGGDESGDEEGGDEGSGDESGDGDDTDDDDRTYSAEFVCSYGSTDDAWIYAGAPLTVSLDMSDDLTKQISAGACEVSWYVYEADTETGDNVATTKVSYVVSDDGTSCTFTTTDDAVPYTWICWNVVICYNNVVILDIWSGATIYDSSCTAEFVYSYGDTTDAKLYMEEPLTVTLSESESLARILERYECDIAWYIYEYDSETNDNVATTQVTAEIAEDGTSCTFTATDDAVLYTWICWNVVISYHGVWLVSIWAGATISEVAQEPDVGDLDGKVLTAEMVTDAGDSDSVPSISPGESLTVSLDLSDDLTELITDGICSVTWSFQECDPAGNLKEDVTQASWEMSESGTVCTITATDTAEHYSYIGWNVVISYGNWILFSLWYGVGIYDSSCTATFDLSYGEDGSAKIYIGSPLTVSLEKSESLARIMENYTCEIVWSIYEYALDGSQNDEVTQVSYVISEDGTICTFTATDDAEEYVYISWNAKVFYENTELASVWAGATIMDAVTDISSKYNKALLLQPDSEEILKLTDFAMIVNGTFTFSVAIGSDGVVVYGVNGDVTGDYEVNASDTLAILRGVSGRTTLDEVEKGFADVNLDGVVNSNDLLAVVKYVSGRTSSLN